MSNVTASSDRSEGIMLRAVLDHLDRHLFGSGSYCRTLFTVYSK